MYQNTTKVTH